ncbi:MAG TPA: TonB-dependent receptor [Planctomycetota bacterium]|nr:TonB-dependent receptor [Planctomycetota bacterium]
MRLALAFATLAVAAWAGEEAKRDVEKFLTEMDGALPRVRQASLLPLAGPVPMRWMLLADDGAAQQPKAGAQPAPAPAPAPPQNPAPAPRAVPRDTGTLPETTVEAATLTERPLSETVPAVNVVDRKEIDKRIPLGVTEAMDWEPGLWSTQGSSGWVGTPVIRGWQGNQVLLLLDGLRLTQDRTPTGPGYDWELLDPDMIHRIEVLRSPDSVLYGTGAIGGVTALSTRYPTDYTDGGTVYGGETRIALASGGLNYWRGRLEGYSATQDFRGQVAGTIFQGADMQSANSTVWSPTAINTWEMDSHMEGRLDEHNTIGGWVFFFRKDWDGNFLRPARVQDNTYSRDAAAFYWRNDAGTAMWDDMEIQVGVVQNSQLVNRTDVQDRTSQDVWTPQATAYFHKGIGEQHVLTYGVSTYMNTVDLQRTTNGVTLRGVPEGWNFDIGAFAQDEWQVNPKLRVVYGLRVDGIWAETDPDAATTDPLIDPDDIRISQSDFAWTGKLGVLYKVAEEWSVTGNFSSGYRFPSLTDLAGFVQAPDEIVVGDPTTEPEYSYTLEGGVHKTAGRWRGSLVGYVSWYQDAIIRTYGTFNGQSWIDRNGDGIQDPDEDVYLTTNAGEATFWGIEAAAVYDVTPQWSVFGNLTWWDGKIDPDPTEPVGIPFNGTLGVNYHPTDRIYFQLASHMVASFDQIPEAFYNAEAFFFRNPQDESQGTLRGDHSVPGYTLWDLRVGVQVTEKATVTIGIDNLFDKKYRAFGDRHDGPGFTFLCGISFDF